MGRLNISIPTDLSPLVSKWRRKINLSEICTQALRDELVAVESHRSARALRTKLQPRTEAEGRLAERFGLAEAGIVESPAEPTALREALGRLAAAYLDRRLCDGAVLGIAGGRQMWCVVQHVSPRQVGVHIQALGYHQNDPRVLHAHPNTLATLLWLFYAPRATARLVGSDPRGLLNVQAPPADLPRYFVIGSCATFAADGNLAQLVGRDAAIRLGKAGASGDFLYAFFNRRGEIIDAPTLADQSVLRSEQLRALSARADARVVLVAGGADKLRVMKSALSNRLCNVVLTDSTTAQQLLRGTKEEV